MSSAALLLGPHAWWRPARGSPAEIAPVFLMASVSASSEAANRPASNVLLLAYCHRTWRSTGIGSDATVTLQLTGVSPAAGLWIDNTNVAQVTLAGSLTGTTWTTLGTFSVPRSGRHGRRGAWIPLGGLFLDRFLRVTFPSASLDAGATFHECGRLALCYPTAALPGLLAPLSWTRVVAHERVGLLGGGDEVSGPSRPYLVCDLALADLPRGNAAGASGSGGGSGAVEGEYRWGTGAWGEGGWPAGNFLTGAAGLGSATAPGDVSVGGLGPTTPFLLIENQGRAADVTYVRRLTADEVAEHFAIVHRPSWAVREVMT